MLPNFIIIGVQRGGTTSLYKHIEKHPKVITPPLKKEIHFFDLNFKKGLEWYKSQFNQNRFLNFLHKKKKIKDSIVGEATPYYIFHPLAPSRISKTLPEVKLIVLLRNPVERAYSHYNHEVRLGFEPLSFEDAIKTESKRLEGEEEKLLEDEIYASFNHQHFSYLQRGIYLDQLEHWTKIFHKDQMLILSSEEFYLESKKICKTVFDFLGLSYFNVENTKTFNKGKYKKMNNKTRIELVEYFKSSNEKLYKFLGRDFGWS